MEKRSSHTLAEDRLRPADWMYRARIVSARREKTPATLPAVDGLLSDPDKTAIEVWTEMLMLLHESGETHSDRCERRERPT